MLSLDPNEQLTHAIVGTFICTVVCTVAVAVTRETAQDALPVLVVAGERGVVSRAVG